MNASNSYNLAKGSDDDAYSIQDVAMGLRHRLRVVCVGAGYSGLLMSIIVSQKMQGHDVDFQVYEKNRDLGGTWLVNRQVISNQANPNSYRKAQGTLVVSVIHQRISTRTAFVLNQSGVNTMQLRLRYTSIWQRRQ